MSRKYSFVISRWIINKISLFSTSDIRIDILVLYKYERTRFYLWLKIVHSFHIKEARLFRSLESSIYRNLFKAVPSQDFFVPSRSLNIIIEQKFIRNQLSILIQKHNYLTELIQFRQMSYLYRIKKWSFITIGWEILVRWFIRESHVYVT